MVTTDEIREALVHVISKQPTELTLRGYVSSSTAQEGDVVFEYHGPDLYGKLLRESFRQISDAGSPLCQRPGDVPLDAWTKALNEQRVSWAESIARHASGTPGPSDVNRAKSYTRHIGGYLESLSDRGVLALEHLLYVKGTITLVKEASGNFRNDITRSKAIIRERSPLSKYIGLVTLSDSKVAQIGVRELKSDE